MAGEIKISQQRYGSFEHAEGVGRINIPKYESEDLYIHKSYLGIVHVVNGKNSMNRFYTNGSIETKHESGDSRIENSKYQSTVLWISGV